MTDLVWHDGWGYRCPRCFLFVCIPQRERAECPDCPKENPMSDTLIEERSTYVVQTDDGTEHTFDSREDAEAFLSALPVEA